MHIASLRIYALHDVLDDTVLARRVHRLENQQHRPAILRVEPLLQLGQALDPFLQEVLGLLLLDIEVVGIAGIPILEMAFVGIVHTIEFGELGEAHAMSLRSIIGPPGSARASLLAGVPADWGYPTAILRCAAEDRGSRQARTQSQARRVPQLRPLG